ncbi:MAG: efflux RND transporter periplasmic adaptor subunit [Bacteroidota bacterium]
MNFKIYLPSLLIICLISACGSKNSGGKENKKNNAPVVIDVSVAQLQGFTNSTEAAGTVLANEYIELKPEASGRIVMLNIKEGQPVAEGTLLMKLFDDDLQAQLKKYKAQLSIAEKTEQRLKTLLSVNGLNQQEYDNASTQVSNVKADIDFTLAQIRKTEIRAPFSGIIGLRNVSMGAYVNQADVLATLQQVNQLKIDFVLPEDLSREISVGKSVDVAVIGGNELMSAKIIAIEPQVNTATRNIKVRAMLPPGKYAGLNPGAFVKVLIGANDQKMALLVPTNAIIPETRNNKIALIKNGKVKFATVETGYRGIDKVEIVKGLTIGDTFAINGILFLKPDAAVTIRNVKP